MKYNMDAEIIGFNGKTIDKSIEDNSPITLGETLILACVQANPQTHTDGAAKLGIYRVLQKIADGGEIELEAEDVVLLKTLVGESFGVVVVGPVTDLLENPIVEDEVEAPPPH